MKKETMKKLFAVLLVLSMISMLCACSKAYEIPVQNEDGSLNVVGLLIEQAINLCTQLALFAVTAFAACAAKMLGKNLKFKNLNIAIQTVCDITRQTVGELQQTTVNDLKAKHYDGKLTGEEISALRDNVLRIVKGKVDEATQELIIASGADLDALIHGECEAYLNQMKQYAVFPIPAPMPTDTDAPKPDPEE